jgi:hypothetical protein
VWSAKQRDLYQVEIVILVDESKTNSSFPNAFEWSGELKSSHKSIDSSVKDVSRVSVGAYVGKAHLLDIPDRSSGPSDGKIAVNRSRKELSKTTSADGLSTPDHHVRFPVLPRSKA